MMRMCYRLFLWLSFFLIPIYLLYRARKQVAYRHHWLERLGFYSKLNTTPPPTIWVHAVSVGETRAAKTLIDQLKKRYPHHHILLTQMTPTGRRTAQTLFSGQVTTVYLPYDYPSAIKRFIRHFQPKLGLLLETEIWPNVIHQCANHNIPLFLVNARLSEKSLRGYLKIKSLIAPALKRLTGIIAQNIDDAQRLEKIGGEHIQISGNIKFDQIPDVQKVKQGLRWKKNLQRPTLLFASSREGEEAMLLEYLSTHPLPKEVLLLIVPRHPERFETIATLIKQHHIPFIRRTQWQGNSLAPHIQILLGNSLGEMESYYSCADITLIGGSFMPFGGHNLIEPALIGIPTIVGPYMFNFTEATDKAVKLGASHQVKDIAEGIKAALYYLDHQEDHPNKLKAIEHFTQQNKGAVPRILNALPQIL